MADRKICVIDSGSTKVRYGFSTESDSPPQVLRTVVGRPTDTTNESVFIGDDALSNKDSCKLSHPIRHGYVFNWDDMEQIWSQILNNKLNVSPEDIRLFLSEAALTPASDREKTAQIAFEKLNVPELAIYPRPYLSLIAHGRDTGVVVDCGGGKTHIVPILDGKICENEIKKAKVAGNDVNWRLKQLLAKKNISFDKSSRREILLGIKESLGFVALDAAEEEKKGETSSYQLPDGTAIELGSETFQSPEILFNPSLSGIHSSGVVGNIIEAVEASDESIKRNMYGNVVLCGGSTLFEGFKERVLNDLQKGVSEDIKLKVICSPEREYASWIGGAILSGISSMCSYVQKADYDENGPTVINK